MSKIDSVREALAELVALKDLKDRLTELHEMGHGTDYGDYHKRQPLAWAAARAALSEQPVIECDCETATAPDGTQRTYCGSAQMKRAVREGHAFRDINLNDRAVQKRLAAQWGFVEPSEPVGPAERVMLSDDSGGAK